MTFGRFFASIFRSATSVRLSAPITLALNSRLSDRRTVTSSAPSTTCALVMTSPSLPMMKPEPTACASGSRSGPRRGGTWPKRRKNS